jgi:IMP cyclohydrolase
MEIVEDSDMRGLERARENFESHLQSNAYPGRGLVVGRASDDDAWLFVYFIMGRSSHSRNRRFAAEGTTLRTEPVDAGLVDDPSLIIYDAMLELPGIHLVSNGDQTRTLFETLESGGSFDDALATREREPDAPNFTPRISAMLDTRSGETRILLSILKANASDPARTDRTTFRPALPIAGFGLGLTTYRGDGSPLPSFEGDPLLLPCEGSAREVLESYWKALDSENRISLAVKRIPDSGAKSTLDVLNRF